MSPQQQLLQDEAAAWRRVASRVARRGLIGLGLCAEITEPHVPKRVRAGMARRVSVHLGDHITMRYVEPVGPEHSDYEDTAGREGPNNRVTAALFLALECEDEADALSLVSRPSSLRRPRQYKRGK